MPRALRWGAVALAAAGCSIPHATGPIAPGAPCRAATGEPPLEITWYGPTERRDATLSQRWCDAAAPPVVIPRPAFAARWSPGDTLTVVTWNVLVGGADLLRFLREEIGLDCAAEGAPARPPAPFVLLLQETYRQAPGLPPPGPGSLVPWLIAPERPGGAELDVVEVARRCDLSLLYAPSSRNGPDGPGRTPEDRGNAVLSTLSLHDPIAIELPFEGGRKVAVGATVRTEEGRGLRVVSVHLDVASTLFRTLLTGSGTRLRQASGLTDALARSSTLATLVGGDFNTWSAEEAALRHMYRLYPSVPLDPSPTRGEFPADHIFIGDVEHAGLEIVPGSYRLWPDSYLSDHRPRAIRLHAR